MRGLWMVGLVATAQGLAQYDLTVGNNNMAPDGFMRPVLTVNDQLPGPTVRLRKGGSVKITVHNKIATGDDLEIHFHGLTQKRTPWMDGTHEAQCPIQAGGPPFVYEFPVDDQVGTYFYHAHSNFAHSTDGVYGALIVEDPETPFHYDEDRVLLLADWWHTTGRQHSEGLLAKDFKWMGDPASLLINGKGSWSCTTSKKWSNCEGLEVVHVEPGKTYYLRLIGAQSLDMMDFAIEDGNYVEPFVTSHVLINAGERYGVLLHTTADHPKESWIMVETRYRKLVAGYGVLAMSGPFQARLGLGAPSPSHEPPAHPGRWSAKATQLEDQFRALEASGAGNAVVGPIKDEAYLLQGQEGMAWARQVKNSKSGRLASPLVAANRFFKFMGTQCKTSDDGALTYYAPYNEPLMNNDTRGYLRWCVNGVTDSGGEPSEMDGEPLQLRAYKNELPLDDPRYLYIDKGDVVEIVLENGWALNRVNEQHPWHLHGHVFWVMGIGEGNWDDQESWKTLNFVDPPLRDTVTVYPFGWAVIRFLADNPGVHMLHCHLKSHHIMGMAGNIIERASEISPPPKGFRTCTMKHDSSSSVHNHMTPDHVMASKRTALRKLKINDQARDNLWFFALAISLFIAILLVAVAFFFCYGLPCGRRNADPADFKKVDEKGGSNGGRSSSATASAPRPTNPSNSGGVPPFTAGESKEPLGNSGVLNSSNRRSSGKV